MVGRVIHSDLAEEVVVEYLGLTFEQCLVLYLGPPAEKLVRVKVAVSCLSSYHGAGVVVLEPVLNQETRLTDHVDVCSRGELQLARDYGWLLWDSNPHPPFNWVWWRV